MANYITQTRKPSTSQRTSAPPVQPASRDPFGAIPHELKQRKQWLVYTLTSPDDKGKRNKLPCNPTTHKAHDENDSSIWLSYRDAVKAWRRNPSRLHGVGYKFTREDPYVGIDLDDCLDAEGNLNQRAQTIVRALNTYTEVSLSGRGVKAIVKAELAHNPQLVAGVEIYGFDRFFALTGKHWKHAPRAINAAQAALEMIVKAHAIPSVQPECIKQSASGASITDNPIAAYNDRISVFDVLDRNKGKAQGRKLYHCPCGVHTGKSASLLVKHSLKYGNVVQGTNSACVFYGSPRAAFDVMRLLECGGDVSKAIAAARAELKMPIEREKRTVVFAPKAPAPAAARMVDAPNAVIAAAIQYAARDTTLCKSQRGVLTALIDHAPNGVAQLTIAQLVTLTGYAESTVQRAIARLHGRYIERHEDANHHGGNVANVYRFNPIVAKMTPPPCGGFSPLQSDARENDTPLLLKESKGGDNSPEIETLAPELNAPPVQPELTDGVNVCAVDDFAPPYFPDQTESEEQSDLVAIPVGFDADNHPRTVAGFTLAAQYRKQNREMGANAAAQKILDAIAARGINLAELATAEIITESSPSPAAQAALSPVRSDAPNELLNQASELVTCSQFAAYEELKAQYPQFYFATDERYSYQQWRGVAQSPKQAHQPVAAGSLFAFIEAA